MRTWQMFGMGLLMAGTAVLAQDAAPVKPVDSGTVHLDVLVHDAAGRPVQGLNEADFTLLDNHAPRKLTSFASVSAEKPATVLIAIDAVNAPFSAVAYQRDQLAKFLRLNEGQLPVPVKIAVVTDKNVRVNQGATRDGNALAAFLQNEETGLREVRRDEGFYGAEERMTISQNALTQMIATEEKEPGRKLIVWISPGWPLLSGPQVNLSGDQQLALFHSVVSYSTILREAHVTLYMANTWGANEGVGRETYYENFLKPVSKPGHTDLADLGFQVMAVQTGGLVQSSNELNSMLQKVVNDAGPYYALTFEAAPAEKQAEFHALAVSVDKPNATVRTRNGYYALP